MCAKKHSFVVKIHQFFKQKIETQSNNLEFWKSLILQFWTVIFSINISSQIHKEIFIDYFHNKKLGQVNKIRIRLSSSK